MMLVSGVRSSCETRETNSDLSESISRSLRRLSLWSWWASACINVPPRSCATPSSTARSRADQVRGSRVECRTNHPTSWLPADIGVPAYASHPRDSRMLGDEVCTSRSSVRTSSIHKPLLRTLADAASCARSSVSSA